MNMVCPLPFIVLFLISACSKTTHNVEIAARPERDEAALHDTARSKKTIPGCPKAAHKVTFFNKCSTAVTLRETSSCYPAGKDKRCPGSLQFKSENNLCCWPNPTPSGTISLPPASKQVVTFPSCYSGNIASVCTTCKTTTASTLVEFTFDGGLMPGSNNGPPIKIVGSLLDNYDISMVDGFNTAYVIKPDMNVLKGGGNCITKGCSKTPICPSKLVDGDACLSPNTYVNAHPDQFHDIDKLKYGCICSTTPPGVACTPDNTNSCTVPLGCEDKFGCSPFSKPGSCAQNTGSDCCPFQKGRDTPPSYSKCFAKSDDRAWAPWAIDYISAVNNACPNIYAWQYNDANSLANCKGEDGAMNYTVTVCPGSQVQHKVRPETET